MKLTLHITGVSPLLMHNGRLANPIDPYAQELAALTSKRKKTDEDHAKIMLAEAEGACYSTTDGYLGFPSGNVWSCIHDAAKGYKLGRDVERALIPDDTIEPVFIAGDLCTVDDHLSDRENILYASVRIGNRRVMRSRPILHDWAMTHHFELLTDILDVEDLSPVLERAGRVVGLGDWRPRYGRFTATADGGDA